MALRLSGRFSVILAISPLNSRIRVEYMAEASLIQKWRMRIFRADFVGHGQHLRQSRAVDAGINAGFAQRCEHRSEEHTSELQSHLNLVCRLLLEKKKKPWAFEVKNVSNT